MLQSNFWISELAERTGVSARTIRYYIEEGLLPQPEIQGKYAVFNEDYLIRLKLIKYLKDAYLPLREIKRKLESLTVPEMSDLLRRFEQDPSRTLAEMDVYPSETDKALMLDDEKKLDSATDYIQRALNRKPIAVKEEPLHFQASMPAPQPKSSYAPESWQRVEIAPGVELNIRQPLSSRVRRQVEELIVLAGKIFSK